MTPAIKNREKEREKEGRKREENSSRPCRLSTFSPELTFFKLQAGKTIWHLATSQHPAYPPIRFRNPDHPGVAPLPSKSRTRHPPRRSSKICRRRPSVDLGGINIRQRLDSMAESDSGPRCRIRMLCAAKPSGRARSPGLGDRAWST